MQAKRAGIHGNPESSSHPAPPHYKSVEILTNPHTYQDYTMKTRRDGGVGAQRHSTIASKAGKQRTKKRGWNAMQRSLQQRPKCNNAELKIWRAEQRPKGTAKSST